MTAPMAVTPASIMVKLFGSGTEVTREGDGAAARKWRLSIPSSV